MYGRVRVEGCDVNFLTMPVEECFERAYFHGDAAAKMGGPRAELRYYHLVPEWITGMGIVVGQA